MREVHRRNISMPLPEERIYTIDDIYDLTEGERAELIDGKIYYMAPPSRQHQKILMEIAGTIRDYIRKNNGSCEVYPVPFAVFLEEDDINYVEPDISVICDKNKLDDKGCNGAPDWIIEIASPSNFSYDYIDKLALYKAAGVREYWIVGAKTKIITVYFFENEIFARNHSFNDKVKVNIYEDLYIDFSQLII